MFNVSRRTALLFLIGYGLHALALLMLDGTVPLPVPEFGAVGIALLGLLMAVAAIWLDLNRLDEVQRRFALNACGVSFAITATISYVSDLPAAQPIIGDASLWAVAIAVWLISFGVFQWRAR